MGQDYREVDFTSLDDEEILDINEEEKHYDVREPSQEEIDDSLIALNYFPEWLKGATLTPKQDRTASHVLHSRGKLLDKYEEKFGKEPPRRLNFFKIRNQIKLLQNSLETGQELDISIDFLRSHIKQG